MHSLSQAITRLKKRVAHLLLDPPSERTQYFRLNDENDAYLDHIDSMERIARLQLNRIRQMVTEEDENGIRQTSMSRDIQALTGLIKAITKAREWEMVHGGIDHVKLRRLEKQKQKINSGFHTLRESIGENGMDRLTKAMGRFLELAEEKAITMVNNPDGTYRLIQPSGEEKVLDSNTDKEI